MLHVQHLRRLDLNRPLYRRAERLTGVPWRLLAAWHYRIGALRDGADLGLNVSESDLEVMAMNAGVRRLPLSDLGSALIVLGYCLQNALTERDYPPLKPDASEDEQARAVALWRTGSERPAACTDNDPAAGIVLDQADPAVGVRVLLRQIR